MIVAEGYGHFNENDTDFIDKHVGKDPRERRA